jgi:hypothetical protein
VSLQATDGTVPASVVASANGHPEPPQAEEGVASAQALPARSTQHNTVHSAIQPEEPSMTNSLTPRFAEAPASSAAHSAAPSDRVPQRSHVKAALPTHPEDVSKQQTKENKSNPPDDIQEHKAAGDLPTPAKQQQKQQQQQCVTPHFAAHIQQQVRKNRSKGDS